MNADTSLWTYRANTERVVDGDTLDLRVDLGFSLTREVRVRLAGVDTAEVHGVTHDSDEHELGMVHQHFVARWLVRADEDHEGEWPLRLRTERDGTGKFGRYIGRVVRVSDGSELTAALVEEYPSVENEQ